MSEQIFNISVAEGKPVIQPDSVLNDRGWKAVSGIGDVLHPAALKCHQQQVTLLVWQFLVFFYYALSDFATHVTETHQSYDQGIVMANKQWWGTLSEDQQRTIMQSFFPIEDARTEIHELINFLKSDLVARGTTMHALNDNQRRLWVAATAATHSAILAEIGGRSQSVYDAIIEGKQAFTTRMSSR